uniref:TOG domain-containing protein n=1 Tax=Steinernema glaseri TaxID=37863 RepID=A0A1I8AKC6_9BILA
MDPWDLYDPVDVLAKLPPNFYEQLESKKWQERKEVLQAFIDIAAANPKFDTKANYGEIVAVLRKVVEKDANINCAAAGAKCVTALANGLRKKFQPHAAIVIPAILEKFKEKKPVLRDPLIECIDAVSATVPMDNLLDDIVAAMGKPNPNIKLQTDQFLYRLLKTFTAATVPKKLVKAAVAPLLVKHTGESDPDVREASYAALGAIMKSLGEKAAMMFLTDIADDKLKMGKIQEFRDKALAECPAPVAEVPKPAPPKEEPKPAPAKEAPAKGPAKKAP